MTDAAEPVVSLSAGYDDPHAAMVRKLADAMLRGAIWWGVGVAAIGMIFFGIVYGLPGVLGALVGGAVAVTSGILTLLLMRSTSRVPVQMIMGIALLGFIGKTALMLVVMLSLKNVALLHPKALAYTMLVTLVVWTAAETRAYAKQKLPTVIPASDILNN
jgi:ATP synthase protein I